MKLKISAFLAVVVLLTACGSKQEPVVDEQVDAVDATVVMTELFEEYAERYVEMNPISATFQGDYRFNDRMANSFSPEYRAASTAMNEEFLQRLLEIDREQLSYQD
jgi:uncharacterized protein (DUF885 family)